MRTRVAMLAASGVVVFAACTVGEQTLNTAEVESEIVNDLEETVGQRPASVDCPETIDAEQGTTFRCTITADDGSQIEGTGTVTEGGGFDFVADQELSRPPTS